MYLAVWIWRGNLYIFTEENNERKQFLEMESETKHIRLTVYPVVGTATWMGTIPSDVKRRNVTARSEWVTQPVPWGQKNYNQTFSGDYVAGTVVSVLSFCSVSCGADQRNSHVTVGTY